MRPGLLFPLLCLTFSFGAVFESFGQTKVPKTWVLRPSDNADGQGFRLLFVTTTPRDAASTDIDVYNSFVQRAAAKGHEAIRPYSEGFRVLGSTIPDSVTPSGVDARDNTSTNPRTDGQGVPIYWLNGEKIVGNYADFWSYKRVDGFAFQHNDKWASYVRTDENGIASRGHGEQRVFTGSRASGVAHGGVAIGGNAVKTGRLDSNPDIWDVLAPIEYSPVLRDNQYPFYGLSEVFVADLTNRAWITVRSLTLDEGASGTYTLALNTDPGADVTVTATSGEGSSVQLSTGGGAPENSAILTFTSGASGTWGAPQTVIVTAAEDTDRDSEQNVLITHTVSAASGPYRSVSIPRVRVDVTDNDTVPVVAFSSASASADEASGTHTATVSLDAALEADLTVAYSLSGDAMRGADYEIAGVTSGSGTITVSGGATTADISVDITDDTVVEAIEAVVLTLTDEAGYTVGATNAHTLTITDNDAPGVTADPVVLNLDEGGADGSYTLVLDAEPSGTVTVTPSSGNSGAVALSGALTFDGSNWDAPQTVTVTPQDDADADDETVTITHAVAGYGSLTAGPEVTVGVNDDEEPATAGVDVSTLALSLSEGGAEGSYTVALRTDPGAAVTVTPSSGDPGAVVVSGALSFDGSNWDAPQTVTVAPQDDADTDDETITITHTVTGYAGVSSASSVQVRVADNDESEPVAPPVASPEVTLSASPNPVAEGASVTITASLSQSLADGVTIPLVVAAGTAEAGDYSAPAPIVVAGNAPSGTGVIATVKDEDLDDETFTVSLGDLPGIVGAGRPSSVEITVTDTGGVTSIESPEEELPASFALDQNYPNPFNPSTTIAFSLDKAQHVTLAVYDLLGQEVRVLADGTRPAGRYRVTFDALDLASGTYLYILKTDERTAVKSMALLK